MSTLPGDYSQYTCKISAEAEKAFTEALGGIIGVRYWPVAVSTKIVSGTNYKFFCNTQVATIRPLNGSSIVKIHAPLEGNAHIIHIQTL
ncbi:hypothetical protein [Kordia jejudonensis]|uniref:hypothetical protein n=1 Tax=Kordia jejudonensis TaxID=1348245 RepID=UPI000629A5B8|nr:hypothetical protein [Kordia jejudonensis]